MRLWGMMPYEMRIFNRRTFSFSTQTTTSVSTPRTWRSEMQVQGKKMEDWLETRSGKKFNFLNPDPATIDIQDIAHGLAKTCRFGGQCRVFYSVAEHSVLLMRHAEQKNKRGDLTLTPQDLMVALLHDASEAYMGDVVRPLKQHLPDFMAIESKIIEVIYRKYNLPPGMPDWLRDMDTRITLDEKNQIMSRSGNAWSIDELQPLGVVMPLWSPEDAAKRFIQEFERLCAMMSVKAA